MSTNPGDEQIADKLREEEEALKKRIRHEATVYATILEEVRKHVGPTEVRTSMKDGSFHYRYSSGNGPKLSATDLKDIATSIFIGIQRWGKRW